MQGKIIIGDSRKMSEIGESIIDRVATKLILKGPKSDNGRL